MSNKNQKKKQERVILSSPWSMKCISIKNEDENIIIRELESLVLKYPGLKNKNKSASRKDSENFKLNENNEVDKKYRKDLVFGINAVTRALEKNSLAAVLISRGANPPHLTKHILPLCATRNVPLVSLKELNGKVAKLMNFSSLMALGIKPDAKQSVSVLHNLWNSIRERAVSVPDPLSWFQTSPVLDSAAASFLTLADDDEEEEMNVDEAGESLPTKTPDSTECPSFLPLETGSDRLSFPVYTLPKKISVRIGGFNSKTETRPEIRLSATRLKRTVPSEKIKKKKKKM